LDAKSFQKRRRGSFIIPGNHKNDKIYLKGQLFMNYQFPGFTIAFVFSAALCIFSAGLTWNRRLNPGSVTFVLLMLSLVTWCFTSVFEAGAMTINGKIFWSKWQYLGITTVSPLWVIFAAEYTGKRRFLTNKNRWLLWIIPLATLVMVFINEMHNLIWTNVAIMPGKLHIGYYSHGIAFYVYMAFSYVCLLTGTIWLVKKFLTSQNSRRFQSVIIVFSVGISWLANVLYVLRLIPIPGLDITPLSFSLLALIISWSISRNILFNLVPIARDTLLGSMVEGVIVIDPNDIVLEINPAALDIIGYDGPQPVGQTIWGIFSKYEEVIEQFRGKTDFQAEVEIPGDPPRTIDLHITSINEEENTFGQLIVLRDITNKKEVEKTEKDQRDFAEALADTAAVINSSLDLDNVLERILENVAKVVPHEAADIALITDEGTAQFVKVKNPEKSSSMEYLLSLKIDLLKVKNFKKMFETHQAMIIADTHEDKDWEVFESSEWIRSYLGAPILHQDKLLGFINLNVGTPDFFKSEHAERLEIFANYAATAITNAKLYSEIRFRAEEMSILYKVSLAIAAGVGLEKTNQAVFRQLQKAIPIDLFFLALYEPTEKKVSYFMYQKNGERIEIEPFYLMQKPSLTRCVVQKKETIYIADFKAEDAEVKEDEVIRVPGFDIRALLGVPLILRGEVIGVLSVQASQKNAYDANQIRLVETVAQQTSIAMDNVKLFEKMQEMAITDSLTGLYNQRYFYMILNNEFERAKRYQTPLSLIVMDIDNFKTVNDEFGHLAGDDVLRSMSEICMKLLRQTDNMFRYGGEEFAIILPGTKQEEAFNVAERICSTIEQAVIKTKNGSVKITVSIGVSEYGENYSKPSEFIESVDRTMYEAKKAGRNCVCVFSKD
jgi:diguanylate cyclase (GGDEF)-like protein/PAS domain S-box-containing protein